jgi:hypothetical protein
MSRQRKEAVSLIKRRLNKLITKWECACGHPDESAIAMDYQCELVALIEQSLDEAFSRGIKMGEDRLKNQRGYGI